MGDTADDNNADHVVTKFVTTVVMMVDAGDDDNADHNVTKFLTIVMALKSQ